MHARKATAGHAITPKLVVWQRMSATGSDNAAPLPAADVHVILFRRDLRVQDHEPLHRVSQLHGQTTPVQLIPLYVYDPLLLRHETSSTAHHLFIGDCLEELSRNLESLGSGLIIRVGHLNGILLSLLRQCNGRRMILWSHHVTGTLHERAHDAATREWCVAHGVTWNELPTGGVWPCSQRHSFQEWLQVWANDFDEYCAAPLFDVPTSSLPPLPLGLRRGQRPTLEAIARLGASHDHAITAAAVQRGGSREAHEVMKSFLTIRRVIVPDFGGRTVTIRSVPTERVSILEFTKLAGISYRGGRLP